MPVVFGSGAGNAWRRKLKSPVESRSVQEPQIPRPESGPFATVKRSRHEHSRLFERSEMKKHKQKKHSVSAFKKSFLSPQMRLGIKNIWATSFANLQAQLRMQTGRGIPFSTLDYLHTYVPTYLGTYIHTYIPACMHTEHIHTVPCHYITLYYITCSHATFDYVNPTDKPTY